MSKKKSRSLPSTPAGKNRPKRLQKTPLVKFVEEPKSDSSSDEDFHPSDVSDEKIDVSEDEINQELTELADEASEYEMMKQYEKMFNDEEENKETSSRKKSKQQSNETNMVKLFRLNYILPAVLRTLTILPMKKKTMITSQYMKNRVRMMIGPMMTWLMKPLN